MKAFLPLILPADHAFWTSNEVSLHGRPPTASFSIPGMIFAHQPGHTVMLVSGPETGQLMRGVPEKYNKFAYSSRYGFSVESDPLGFKSGAFDSMIALSDDGIHYRVREHCAEAVMAGEMLFSVWHPWEDVKVETWLILRNPWHLRIHRVTSPRGLSTVEGGFAAPHTDFNRDQRSIGPSSAYVLGQLGDFSGILDISEPQRSARVNEPHGNTSVMFPRTLVPQLLGEVQPNVPTVFACAALADPNGQRGLKEWSSPPEIPEIDALNEIVGKDGIAVAVVKNYNKGNASGHLRESDEPTNHHLAYLYTETVAAKIWRVAQEMLERGVSLSPFLIWD
jgi:hypothetical protein